MNELTLLHIADVHLGGSGPAFGARVPAHHKRLEEALARAIDLALFDRVTAVCIVGDLFHTPRPAERTLQTAARELARLGAAAPPIPCLILPGNHDCLQQPGIFHRPEFSGEHLRVWREPGPATFHLLDGALAVHGNPQPCGVTRHRPLEGLAPDASARFNVALAHGGVLIPGVTEDEAALITPQEIAACGMDYVALGHWHDPGDQSSGGVTAHYCGATEIIDIGQREPGGALMVTLREGGAAVERLPTGALRNEKLTLDAEAQPDEAAVAAAIAGHADERVLLDVTLVGLAPEGFTCDPARLQEELEDGFFRLRISDRTVPATADVPAHGLADSLIAARAMRLFQERIAQAEQEGDAEGAHLARRALQLAVALFDGREVVG